MARQTKPLSVKEIESAKPKCQRRMKSDPLISPPTAQY
ncbi:exopolygalacturonate lyase [Escherichia coli]|nr:exopolygalacturonate lyase [Escherichia coli]EEW3526088.1 exopolygalacturonate lyase [Escherichia coli]EEW5315822.1 exopolygalacturonate lyase [Escherichia coli]EEW9411756.1 exopolygalacturonate lyase [Escherichia coli]EFB1610129.1 exopolygalacturonate lyase [Escherichia coli]